MNFLFGVLPLSRTPVAERVGQGEVLVKTGQTWGRWRSSWCMD